MRMKKSNNSGMTLVEVLVSMLVLSIAVVTVMTTFSMAKKVNVKSEQMQSIESLMENLLEYTEAGGTDYETTFLSSSGTGSTTVSGSKTINELSSVKQGFYNYKVRITTDTEPTEYETAKLNNHGVIHFGGSNSNTVMLNASWDSVSYADDIAMGYYSIQHAQAVDDFNNEELQKAAEDPSYTPAPTMEAMTEENIWPLVNRELWLMTESPNPDKITLCAYMVYKIDNTALEYPDGVDTTCDVFVWRSEEYDAEWSTAPNPKKLNQVYVLYSDSENAALGTQDIRILDTVGVSLDTSFYFVMQETLLTSKTVSEALNAETFEERIGNSGKVLHISFRDPRDNNPKRPKATRVYCSATITLEDADHTVTPPDITNPLSIVAKGEEVRVVTVTLEILDANSGVVLDTKTITRLQ